MFDDWKRKLVATVAGGAIVVAAAVGFLPHRGVDTAGEVLTPQAAQAMVADGNDLFGQAVRWWPGCSAPGSVPWVAKQNLQVAFSAGMETVAYIVLDPYTSGADAVDQAYDALGADDWNNLSAAAIDFEVPAECYPWAAIPIETVCGALDELQRLGAPRLLYSSFGEWVSRLSPSNPPMCVGPDGSPTYIWQASWGTDPDHVDVTRYPWGGIEPWQVLIKQYQGTTTVQNISVDLDSWVGEWPWYRVPRRPQDIATPTPEPSCR